MKSDSSLSTEYFETIYAKNEDPWNFETSEYEREKYKTTLEALPKNLYENALEVGCSIGVLTYQLAAKCKKLTSIDVSSKALEIAKKRCAGLPQVHFEQKSFLDDFPSQNFDLIMVSEVAYYLSEKDWDLAMQKIDHWAMPKAHIVLVHWLPEVPDYPQTGDQVHERFKQKIEGKMVNKVSFRAEKYRLDLWEKN